MVNLGEFSAEKAAVQRDSPPESPLAEALQTDSAGATNVCFGRIAEYPTNALGFVSIQKIRATEQSVRQMAP